MGTRIITSALTRNIRKAMNCSKKCSKQPKPYLLPAQSLALLGQAESEGRVHTSDSPTSTFGFFTSNNRVFFQQHPGAVGVIISTTELTSLHYVINLIVLFIRWLSTVLNVQISAVTNRHPRFYTLHQEQRLGFDLVT